MSGLTAFSDMQLQIIKTIMKSKVIHPQQKLPTYIAEGEFDCSICLDKVHIGQQITILPCSNTVNHKYHVKCIQPWLKEHNNCPQCRAKIY